LGLHIYYRFLELEIAINSGANECFSEKEFHEIQCDKNQIYKIKGDLEKTIKNFISTDICWLPLNSVEAKGERLKIVLEFLEELENDDDVQNVYTNLITGIN